jgi:hypothetical protein
MTTGEFPDQFGAEKNVLPDLPRQPSVRGRLADALEDNARLRSSLRSLVGIVRHPDRFTEAEVGHALARAEDLIERAL